MRFYFSGSASNFSIKSVESIRWRGPDGYRAANRALPPGANNLLLFQSKAQVSDLRQRGIFIKSQIISFIEIILPYSLSL